MHDTGCDDDDAKSSFQFSNFNTKSVFIVIPLFSARDLLESDALQVGDKVFKVQVNGAQY
jgi:hypothetical protein